MQVQDLYPKPLCGTDGGYTYESIVVRLAKIILETSNKLQPHVYTSQQQYEAVKAKLVAFSNIIRTAADKPIPAEYLLLPPVQVTEEWQEWKQCEAEFEFADKTWLSISWLFLETYVYRKMLELCEYYGDQASTSEGDNKKEAQLKRGLRDPFELQKREALAVGMKNLIEFAHSAVQHYTKYHEAKKSSSVEVEVAERKELTQFLLHACLWGNQIDLSVTGGMILKDDEMDKKSKEESSSSHIVLNDTAEAIAKFESLLLAQQSGSNNTTKVAFIVDNAGPEIVADMFLADALVQLGMTSTVTFFVKEQPVFVSDAMIKDFEYTIEQLQACGDATMHKFATRFQHYFTTKTWVFQEDRFFTLPLPFWDMPHRVRSAIAEHSLCIIKGDANYRKLINDLHWDTLNVEFKTVVKHYFPTSLISLRTLKSESLVGLTTDERRAKAMQLDKDEPNWRTTGKYGIVQYME